MIIIVIELSAKMQLKIDKEMTNLFILKSI